MASSFELCYQWFICFVSDLFPMKYDLLPATSRALWGEGRTVCHSPFHPKQSSAKKQQLWCLDARFEDLNRSDMFDHSNSSVRSSRMTPAESGGSGWELTCAGPFVPRSKAVQLTGQIIWDEMITIRFGWRGDSLIASKSPNLWAIMICCHGMFGGADHQKGGCDSHCGVDSLGGCVGSWGLQIQKWGLQFALGLCWLCWFQFPCKCGVFYPNSTVQEWQRLLDLAKPLGEISKAHGPKPGTGLWRSLVRYLVIVMVFIIFVHHHIILHFHILIIRWVHLHFPNFHFFIIIIYSRNSSSFSTVVVSSLTLDDISMSSPVKMFGNPVCIIKFHAALPLFNGTDGETVPTKSSWNPLQ